MILLSILIPTHNRPILFKRCLESALLNKPDNVEIIVNNDSNDIEKINYKNVFYYNNKFKNLKEIYQFLVSKAHGKYVYFLEDDDILLKSFYKVLENLQNFDAVTGWYVADEIDIKKRFQKFDINSKFYQLSQVIFKKSILNFDLNDACNGNCIFNDWWLFKKSNIKNIFNSKFFFFKQTHDGNDNLSYSKYNDFKRCFNCSFKYFNGDF